MIVVGDEGVAEGLQLSDGLRLSRLSGEPHFEGLVEAFHFAAGGGVVGLGVLLGHAEVAQQGGEAVAY